MAHDNLTWHQVDISTLAKGAQAALQKYRIAAKVAAEARDLLSKQIVMQMKTKGVIPEGHEPLISYRFGKVSVAFTEPTERATKRDKGGLDLS